MQNTFSGGNVVSRDKATVLVLLAASTVFGVLASDVGGLVGQAEAGTASHRLLLATALAGSLIAVLMLLSPGKNHRSLASTLRAGWWQIPGLALLVLLYALVLKSLGIFIATSLFLAAGFLLLGERHLWRLLVASIPAAALLALLMHAVFGIAAGDPLLHTLGIAA
jgi:putative tricarboxylic transport membrane protein